MNRFKGSNFDDFLEEEGILEEVSAKAHKRLLALQLSDIMQEKQITKTSLAAKLKTSRSQLVQMEAELPKACNVGTKRNSKGHTSSWIGYKLHSDASDDGIPVSCILSSVSLHDSQVAIPLALKTKQRVSISVKC